jgi:hypothetical protein
MTSLKKIFSMFVGFKSSKWIKITENGIWRENSVIRTINAQCMYGKHSISIIVKKCKKYNNEKNIWKIISWFGPGVMVYACNP